MANTANYTPKVSALFVRRNSIYKKLGVDCWDIDRDARNFPGGNPVIAHPPCRAWGKLKAFAKPRPGEKELAILAIKFVRENGGVLEHPSGSSLFIEYLPKPAQKDAYGFTISVDQHWWGHKARKRTYLYIVGCDEKDLPPIPLNFHAITHIVSTSRISRRNGLKELSKAAREATPPAFAKWLIDTARICSKS